MHSINEVGVDVYSLDEIGLDVYFLDGYRVKGLGG